MEIIIALLVLIIALLVNHLVAKKFMEIAEMKGHEGGSYYWYTFLMGAVGMLMVVALPDVSEKNQQRIPAESMTYAAKPEPKTQNYCTNCGRAITHYPCDHCGYRPERQSAPYWCGKCGHVGPYEGKCPECGSTIKVFNNRG